MLARDPATGRAEPRLVVDAFKRTTDRLRILTVRGPDGNELPPIRTTDEHPFWVVDIDDFVPAGELEPGDQFLGPNGELQTLAASRAEEHPEGVTVYNFEVEGAHTYYVLPGEQSSLHGPPVLVHNTCGGDISGEDNDRSKGLFSIWKWSGYPKGMPRPKGPFRLLEGDEYAAARKAANAANRAIHKADPSLADKQIHEIHPVKFGGSPTDASNKIPLSQKEHTPLTNWWNLLMRSIRGN